MRAIDTPEQQPTFGAPIRSEPPVQQPKPARWTPIESQPGYVRNADGSVKRADANYWPGFINHFWGAVE